MYRKLFRKGTKAARFGKHFADQYSRAAAAAAASGGAPGKGTAGTESPANPLPSSAKWRLVIAVAAVAMICARSMDFSRLWTGSKSKDAEVPLEQLPNPRDLEWRVLSKEPRVLAMDDFLSAQECAFLRSLAAERLEPAMVVEDQDNQYDQQATLRDNRQLWLTPEEEASRTMVQHIIKRMHRAARLPDDEAEALQIGHYALGQKYEVHHDTDPTNGVSRPATLIVYLNDVEEGGETFFPMDVNRTDDRGCGAIWHSGEDGARHFGVAGCCQSASGRGLRVPPRMGRAVLIWNHDLQGKRDALAEHAGCPVRAGEKWIAQRWFRFEPYQRIIHPADSRFDGLPGLFPPSMPEEVEPGKMDVRVLSLKAPRVYLLEDFLTPGEVKHVSRLASQANLTRESGGDLMSSGWVDDEAAASDTVLARVVKRMHRAALIPDESWASGGLKLARFEPGGSMAIHTDGGRSRGKSTPMTLLVYLEGDGNSAIEGATVFPRGACRDLSDCCTELAAMKGSYGAGASSPLLVPPQAGRALLFASHLPNGQADPLSRHGSCPAGPEGKFTLQRFFRARPETGVGRSLYSASAEFDGLGALSP